MPLSLCSNDTLGPSLPRRNNTTLSALQTSATSRVCSLLIAGGIGDDLARAKLIRAKKGSNSCPFLVRIRRVQASGMETVSVRFRRFDYSQVGLPCVQSLVDC